MLGPRVQPPGERNLGQLSDGGRVTAVSKGGAGGAGVTQESAHRVHAAQRSRLGPAALPGAGVSKARATTPGVHALPMPGRAAQGGSPGEAGAWCRARGPQSPQGLLTGDTPTLQDAGHCLFCNRNSASSDNMVRLGMRCLWSMGRTWKPSVGSGCPASPLLPLRI